MPDMSPGPMGAASDAPTPDEAPGTVGAGLAPPASDDAPPASDSAPPASDNAPPASDDAPPIGGGSLAALVAQALAAASETRHLTLEAGAIQTAARAFRATFGDRPAVVVADPTTWIVAGPQV